MRFRALGGERPRLGDRLAEDGHDRRVERGHLVVGQRVGELERGEPGGVQDLVGVRVADPGDQPLIAEQPFDLGTAGPDDLTEPGHGEAVRQRIDPQAGDARHLGRVVHHVEREALARARLVQLEPRRPALGVRREPYPGGERTPPGPGGPGAGEVVAPAQPAAPAEVRDQVQALALQVEELAVPVHAGDRPPHERRRRRVHGLQRLDRDHVGPGDRTAAGPRAQEGGERLDLGQLRHALQVPGARRGNPAAAVGRRIRRGRPRRRARGSCPR